MDCLYGELGGQMVNKSLENPVGEFPLKLPAAKQEWVIPKKLQVL